MKFSNSGKWHQIIDVKIPIYGGKLSSWMSPKPQLNNSYTLQMSKGISLDLTTKGWTSKQKNVRLIKAVQIFKHKQY